MGGGGYSALFKYVIDQKVWAISEHRRNYSIFRINRSFEKLELDALGKGFVVLYFQLRCHVDTSTMLFDCMLLLVL